ncbi:MAG: preprotein translocase subunit SecA [Planctomycetes bacterium]|nr:preprotein translocase subunit SecA [Planctomycetota bacterium]
MDWDQFQDSFGSAWASIGRGLKGIFGSRNERYIRTLVPAVQRINSLESWAQGLSQEQMMAKTQEWKAAVQSGKATLDGLLPEAFALVREAGKRVLNMRHFDVQLVGGMVLHQGKIAEMSTGEGKTLMATLPCYLNALAGKGVYVVTVNDYLAQRDRDWMAPIHEYLGMKVGAIQQWMSPEERKPQYACDITYGTNSEFGFDYLRDNMKWRAEDQVQKNLYFAIVDEVDSILIDEARTPLIISGPAEASSEKYVLADRIAKRLQPGTHFEIKEKEKQCILTDEGIEEAEKLVGVDSFYSGPNMDWPHLLETALRAHNLYQKDKEYVVRNSEEDGRPEVVIVDEFTGRMMPGRRWSEGLHQAVEAKEGIKPRDENQTLATITYQNYFRLFQKLAGMTGTAMTEAAEFMKIYNLDVATIPTNRPMVRKDNADVVYRTSREKWNAIADEIEKVHKNGQPLLVGTTSIEKSELLSGILQRRNIPHQVLNAKHHEREATIVSKAGEKGAVTVATNMAGRGTDIKLGEGVKDLGGLYVLGTERHEARRIDNQLRGRSGRQGDPGYSRFYLALDDDLMRIFYRDWVSGFMEKLGMTEGQAIESPMVTRAIEKAQKKVEQRNFEIRKSLLEYDEVMDQQRKVIYRQRQDALELRDLRDKSIEMLRLVCNKAVREVLNEKGADADLPRLCQWVHRKFGMELTPADFDGLKDAEPITEELTKRVLAKYDETEKRETADNMRRIEQYLLLTVLDQKWKDHLRDMDALKSGIGLRGWAQEDPKNAYKAESFKLFEAMLAGVAEGVTDHLFRLHLPNAEEIAAQRKAEQKREDAQRIFQAALEAGVVKEQAAGLAQAVFNDQIEPDKALEMIRKAKEAAESGAPAAPAEPSPDALAHPDAQKVLDACAQAGIVQQQAMQLAAAVGSGQVTLEHAMTQIQNARAEAETRRKKIVDDPNARRVLETAIQNGVVEQHAWAMADEVAQGTITADEQLAKMQKLIEQARAEQQKLWDHTDGKRVLESARDAGLNPQQAFSLAAQVVEGKVPVDQAVQMIQNARTQAEDAMRKIWESPEVQDLLARAKEAQFAEEQARGLVQAVLSKQVSREQALDAIARRKESLDLGASGKLLEDGDAKRVLEAAKAAGVVEVEATALAGAVYSKQLPADQALELVRKAREQFEAQMKARSQAPASAEQRPAAEPRPRTYDVMNEMEAQKRMQQMAAQRAAAQGAVAEPGRNDPCPCGSGKKFKACHGKSA